MSQRKTGRDWIPEGPASAAATSALAMLGRVAVPDEADEGPTGGSGEIERRQATDAQRAAWRDAAPAVSPIAPVRATPKPAVVPRPIPALITTVTEELVMPAPTPLSVAQVVDPSLSNLQAAVQEAIAADAAMVEAMQRWHAASAAMRAAWDATGLDVDPEDAQPPDGPPMAHHVLEIVVDRQPSRAEVRHEQLVNGDPADPQAAKPTIPPFKRRMLDALVANEGDYTKTAKALGLKRSSVLGTMSSLRKLTGLTEAEQAVVARRRVV